MCDNDSYDRRKVIWVSAVIFNSDVEDVRYQQNGYIICFEYKTNPRIAW